MPFDSGMCERRESLVGSYLAADYNFHSADDSGFSLFSVHLGHFSSTECFSGNVVGVEHFAKDFENCKSFSCSLL